jgi:excisionase family DNA binding protein
MSGTIPGVGEYVTPDEAAKRLGCSKRHVERIIAANDAATVGVRRVGRRVVRLHWPTFDRAMTAGRLRS